jgi:hypothetical protein
MPFARGRAHHRHSCATKEALELHSSRVEKHNVGWICYWVMQAIWIIVNICMRQDDRRLQIRLFLEAAILRHQCNRAHHDDISGR